MTQLIRLDDPPPETVLPPIDQHVRETFRPSDCWPALVPKGTTLYRYGTTHQQVTGSRQAWINFSEDCLRTSDEVIQQLCLLDFTVANLEPGTGPGPQPWNTASLRGRFQATQDLHVWAGAAGSMAFDVYTGLRYRGPGDQYAHIWRAGGGSQILVHRTHMDRIALISQVPLPPVEYLV